ncbi:DUF998 domain-containing protein [uncultured Devosia sp.]|uniref:DUF998 domain-containing protein n=1 Tax=uncultured Devosia sp. TaxID=211434 RepID=UPI002628ED6C|nr:DUF998 domain-containing protein [uncultured Devosia sp.]
MIDRVRLGGLCWVVCASFFLAQLAAHLAAPGHDLFRYDISLLGVSNCGVYLVATTGSTDLVCSPLHAVFNLGIIIHGAAAIIGILLTRPIWPSGQTTSWALGLLALGGLGAILVGAFPIDRDMLVHIVGAVASIAAAGLGFLLLALTLHQSAPQLAGLTALVGVVVLLAGLGHALGGVPWGRGTMERLAVWPQTIWYVGVGIAVLSKDLQLRRSTATRRANLGSSVSVRH